MTKIVLPKDALQRVDLGKGFAEYDLLRNSPELFVSTPATLSALSKANTSCLYVGRRGSGKTAITIEVERKFPRTVTLLPQIFDLLELPLSHSEFRDTRQRPFKSLRYAVEQALLTELVRLWVKSRLIQYEVLPQWIRKERSFIENNNFDERFLGFCGEIFDAYKDKPSWLKLIKKRDELLDAVKSYSDDARHHYIFLIDRLDESWDGSGSALVCLMALMHAAVGLIGMTPCIKPYVFIRENIYDRIRGLDNEFSRLETSVVLLDWTEEKLAELVARRLVKPFNTKPKLSEAWGYFFEEAKPKDSILRVMQLCQHRPRDVLMLCDYAIKSAINENRLKIAPADVAVAEKRYSTSRLKDLGDEYAENYPNISIVLEYFYGLGNEFTVAAIEDFIKKLIMQERIQKHCADWFYSVTPTFQFVELLYSIGFIGLRDSTGTHYKGAGTEANSKPIIDHSTTFVVHPTYSAALNLRPILLPNLSDDTLLQNEGILEDLPEGFDLDRYKKALADTLAELKTLPHGANDASKFEKVVGEVIRLCFFRSLTNIQAKERSADGTTVRDWIASNRASKGFWEVIRAKHGATQVVWECKNYADLTASDFHQAQYYMNKTSGYFSIIAFRGNRLKESSIRHVANIANKNDSGLVLPLTQNDLEVFLRQAIKGTTKEAHIQDRYDAIVRQIA